MCLYVWRGRGRTGGRAKGGAGQAVSPVSPPTWKRAADLYHVLGLVAEEKMCREITLGKIKLTLKPACAPLGSKDRVS